MIQKGTAVIEFEPLMVVYNSFRNRAKVGGAEFKKPTSLIPMDCYFVDITIEFLAVAFHNILYYASVYPRSVFETRKKYGTVVYRSIHPEINEYIDLCLKCVEDLLKNGRVHRIELAVTNNDYKPLAKFVFNLDINKSFDDTVDAYLVKTEQSLRAYILRLSSISHKISDLTEDPSFTIYIHTNESTAVALAANPDLEGFPLVEVEENSQEMDGILPLGRFSIRNFNFDSYVEK